MKLEIREEKSIIYSQKNKNRNEHGGKKKGEKNMVWWFKSFGYNLCKFCFHMNYFSSLGTSTLSQTDNYNIYDLAKQFFNKYFSVIMIRKYSLYINNNIKRNEIYKKEVKNK